MLQGHRSTAVILRAFGDGCSSEPTVLDQRHPIFGSLEWEYVFGKLVEARLVGIGYLVDQDNGIGEVHLPTRPFLGVRVLLSQVESTPEIAIRFALGRVNAVF